jgi:Pentapeptide repeats (8 copies)
MADLYGADLSYSDFHGAALHFTNLREATLVGTNFSEESFLCTNFEDARMRGTNFSDATLDRVILSLQRLSPARRKRIRELMEKIRRAARDKRKQAATEVLATLGAKRVAPTQITFLDTDAYLGYDSDLTRSDKVEQVTEA